MKFLSLTAALGTVLLAGCSVSPKDYETTPVVVASAAGPVTCQLYTHSQVTWDRSIGHPNSMSVADADAICRQEGFRVMRGEGTGTAATTVPAGTTVVVPAKL